MLLSYTQTHCDNTAVRHGGEMVKKEWGMDEGVGVGEGDRRGDLFLNTFSISWRSVVWTYIQRKTPTGLNKQRDL